MDYIKTLVSGNKNRYVDDKYNLDLTYVTPRVIAMAFPGSGLKTIYRNNINDVANFLSEKHNNCFRIINLSGNSYDSHKFHNQVIEYNDWLDHHSPPINLLFTLCEHINSWLSKKTENVIVINCNAGKGRTGTLICCYLLFSGRFTTPQDSFDYYSLKRFKEGHGVTHPSQQRYVKYFYHLLHNDTKYFPYRRRLTAIQLNKPPFEDTYSITPVYKIHDSKLNKELHSYKMQSNEIIILPNTKKYIDFSEKDLSIEIYGDIMIHMYTQLTLKDSKVGRLAFNTAFISKDASEYIFPLNEIDPYSFCSNPKVAYDYKIILKLEKMCNCNNLKDLTNLCDECSFKLKTEIEEWKGINKIISEYNNTKEKGSLLLFGNNENDDVDQILKERGTLKSVVHDISSLNHNSKTQDNCLIY